MMRRASLLAAAALALASTRAVAQERAELPPVYVVRKAIALAASDGVAGRLELLEDARITPAIRPELNMGGMEYACVEPDTPPLRAACASARRTRFRGAMVRLVAADGRVLDTRTFERELGDIGFQHLYGTTRRTYFVTNDLSIGMGSYAGPVTRLAEVRGGRLRWLRATDVRTGAAEEISLVSTLKTEWRVVPRQRGPGRDILMFLCRPDPNAALSDSTDRAFLLIYERDSFENGAWRLHRRSEHGFWEQGDDPFPPRRRFP
jgi:hypothetical protein